MLQHLIQKISLLSTPHVLQVEVGPSNTPLLTLNLGHLMAERWPIPKNATAHFLPPSPQKSGKRSLIGQKKKRPNKIGGCRLAQVKESHLHPSPNQNCGSRAYRKDVSSRRTIAQARTMYSRIRPESNNHHIPSAIQVQYNLFEFP